MLKFLMVFLFTGASLLVFFGLYQIFSPKMPPSVIQFFLIMLGITSLFFGLFFLLCSPIFLIKWLLIRKELPKIEPTEKKKNKIKFFVGLGFAVAAIIFFTIVTVFHLGAKTCDNVECFIAKANNCMAVKWRTVDSVGMEWSFYASSFCRFEKKLLTITGNESEGMKNVLEGQGLSCDYKKNLFDSMWVNSLIFNLEPCQGELKESIAKLLLFL